DLYNHVWRTELVGELTAPVVAEGKVFVASIDAHTIYALDEETGKVSWKRVTGGAVDSPPTIYAGIVVYGCTDGYVYAHRAEDGELLWKFRAAPADRNIGAYSKRLESAWPVHGSVLCDDGAIYCCAGRNTYVDGGIRFYKLNPFTGEVLVDSTFFYLDKQRQINKDPDIGKIGDVEGFKNNILSANEAALFVGEDAFERDLTPIVGTSGDEYDHLFAINNFLDDTWAHRFLWTYSNSQAGGYNGFVYQAANEPAGRILVFDSTRVYGYRRKIIENKVEDFSAHLICSSKDKYDSLWTRDSDIIVRATALCDNAIIIAGPRNVDNDSATNTAAFEGKYGSLLQAVSKENGALLNEWALDTTPVFDGMAIAHDRVFCSLENGSVVCYAEGDPVGIHANGIRRRFDSFVRAIKSSIERTVERNKPRVTPVTTENAEEKTVHKTVPSVPSYGVLRSYWPGVVVDSLADIVEIMRTTSPLTSTVLSDFDNAANAADNYVELRQGYLVAPVSGYYKFALSCDEFGMLVVSTDSSSALLRTIARVNAPMKPDEWHADETATERIYMEEGARYYVEVYHAEQSGDDHCMIGWIRPDAEEKMTPIAAEYFVPPTRR
ncbi:MAG: PQQ-binding-like beta-propeller repeat protein, partial [Chitinivibrionales bacterium]|nr:PQQ-binding-like beta-propeller repeat protein [Chitinivibrionales bacterium]